MAKGTTRNFGKKLALNSIKTNSKKKLTLENEKLEQFVEFTNLDAVETVSKSRSKKKSALEKLLKKKRNSERRKEKSRDAARNRRGYENEIFHELGSLLPLGPADLAHLDKASLLRVVIGYLHSRDLVRCVLSPRRSGNWGSNHLELQSPCDVGPTGEDALDALDGFLLTLTKDCDVVYVTENVKPLLGLSQMEMVGHSLLDYTHPCDHDEVRRLSASNSFCSKSLLEGGCFFVRFKCTLTARGRSVALKSATYKMVKLSLQLIQDTDEHKSIIKKRHMGPTTPVKSEVPTVTWALALGVPMPHPSNIETPLDKQSFITKHSLDMKFIYVDDNVRGFCGYVPGDLIGRSFYDLSHAHDARNIMEACRNLKAKGQIEIGYFRFLARGSGYIWVLTRATQINGGPKNPRPESIVCVNYVISGIECSGTVFSDVQLECFSSDNKAFQTPLIEAHSLEENIIQDQIVEDQPKEIFKSEEPAEDLALPAVPRSLSLKPKPLPVPATFSLLKQRTRDVREGFVSIAGGLTVETELKKEPEDLTHLAPSVGDACVALEVPVFQPDWDGSLIPTETSWPLPIQPDLPQGPDTPPLTPSYPDLWDIDLDLSLQEQLLDLKGQDQLLDSKGQGQFIDYKSQFVDPKCQDQLLESKGQLFDCQSLEDFTKLTQDQQSCAKSIQGQGQYVTNILEGQQIQFVDGNFPTKNQFDSKLLQGQIGQSHTWNRNLMQGQTQGQVPSVGSNQGQLLAERSNQGQVPSGKSIQGQLLTERSIQGQPLTERSVQGHISKEILIQGRGRAFNERTTQGQGKNFEPEIFNRTSNLDQSNFLNDQSRSSGNWDLNLGPHNQFPLADLSLVQDGVPVTTAEDTVDNILNGCPPPSVLPKSATESLFTSVSFDPNEMDIFNQFDLKLEDDFDLKAPYIPPIDEMLTFEPQDDELFETALQLRDAEAELSSRDESGTHWGHLEKRDLESPNGFEQTLSKLKNGDPGVKCVDPNQVLPGQWFKNGSTNERFMALKGLFDTPPEVSSPSNVTNSQSPSGKRAMILTHMESPCKRLRLLQSNSSNQKEESKNASGNQRSSLATPHNPIMHDSTNHRFSSNQETESRKERNDQRCSGSGLATPFAPIMQQLLSNFEGKSRNLEGILDVPVNNSGKIELTQKQFSALLNRAGVFQGFKDGGQGSEGSQSLKEGTQVLQSFKNGSQDISKGYNVQNSYQVDSTRQGGSKTLSGRGVDQRLRAQSPSKDGLLVDFQDMATSLIERDAVFGGDFRGPSLDVAPPSSDWPETDFFWPTEGEGNV